MLIRSHVCILVGPMEHSSERRRGDTKDNPLSQWYMNFSEADELLKLAAARQQVRMMWLSFLYFQYT